MAYGTGGFVTRNQPRVDQANQNYLSGLTGAMSRNGATVGATGGLNYGTTPYSVPMVGGPTSQQVSGNAITTPDPVATLQPPPTAPRIIADGGDFLQGNPNVPPTAPVQAPAAPPIPAASGAVNSLPGGVRASTTGFQFNPQYTYEQNLVNYRRANPASDLPDTDPQLALLAEQQRQAGGANPFDVNAMHYADQVTTPWGTSGGTTETAPQITPGPYNPQSGMSYQAWAATPKSLGGGKDDATTNYQNALYGGQGMYDWADTFARMRGGR